MSDIFGGPPDDPPDVPIDRFGVPEDYSELMGDDPADAYTWWGNDTPADWWYQQVELQDDYGDLHYMTGAQWYEATTMDPELTMQLWNLEPLDIIHELEDLDLWTDEDWETWREFYEGA